LSGDTLSDVLRAVRLQGAVFFAVDAAAPWVAEAPAARTLAPHVMPGAGHVIEYHIITRGSCWGGIVDDEPVHLDTGDVIVFPQGDAHVLSSAPGMRGTSDPAPFEAAQTSRLPIALHLGDGGPERTEAICGFLGCDAGPFNPLLAALPRVLVARRAADGGLIEQLVRLALAESLTSRAGGDAVLSRLSEVLFVEVVRRHLEQLPAEQTGWLAGLRDESTGRALARLHERPAHDWSLDELARECGISRSVLAERFTHVVGQPPMQYLARWRMQLAAQLLATTSLGLGEIADRVGYGSETALSRAYKRWVGVAPAEWRRTRAAAGLTGPPS
jgi:AraC-like DNA-binding protein